MKVQIMELSLGSLIEWQSKLNPLFCFILLLGLILIIRIFNATVYTHIANKT